MYIYKHPNFVIPKEFQDWLVWAWDWQHNWTTVTDISWNWNNWTQTDVVFSRKNNAHQMSFNGSSSKVNFPNLNWFNWNPTYSFVSFFWWVTDSSSIWWFINVWWYWTNSQSNAFRLSWNWWLQNYWWYNDLNTSNINVCDWKWHLVIAQFDWNERSIWVDWTKYGSDNPTWHNVTQDWENTIWKTHGSEYFPWQIWLSLIYNKALTSQQISKMYEYFRQWYYN